MTVAANLLSRGNTILIGKSKREIETIHQSNGKIVISYRDARGSLRRKTVGANQPVKIA
jgi:hypothetical protein